MAAPPAFHPHANLPADLRAPFADELWDAVEIELKYAGYITRQEAAIESCAAVRRSCSQPIWIIRPSPACAPRRAKSWLPSGPPPSARPPASAVSPPPIWRCSRSSWKSDVAGFVEPAPADSAKISHGGHINAIRRCDVASFPSPRSDQNSRSPMNTLPESPRSHAPRTASYTLRLARGPRRRRGCPTPALRGLQSRTQRRPRRRLP